MAHLVQSRPAGLSGPAERMDSPCFLLCRHKGAGQRRGNEADQRQGRQPCLSASSHLISFLWNPYRPAAVHTATQNAPTSQALPR